MIHQIFRQAGRSVPVAFALFVLMSTISGLTAPVLAQSASPQLSIILPRGAQRGTEQTFRFSGARLAEAQQVLLYDTSGVEVVGINQVDANNVDVTLKISPECRLGEHVAQIRTLRGISDYRSFYVGALPEVAEAEPNNGIDAPQAIEKNVTVVGTVTNEDIDWYEIQCIKGERISVEIEAIRLGTMFDSFISILDANRFELATCDDSALAGQDGILSVVVPEDGKYYVTVREASFGGNDNCRYRLHVGNFPRPTVAYPAGGPLGSEVQVQYLGDPTGPISETFTVAEDTQFRPGRFVQDDLGVTPSPIAFRPGDIPNVMEAEPNNTWSESEPAALPAAFNGIIQEPGDVDFHKFSAKKGEAWDIHCFARRIGSGLDPVINIYNASTKAHIVGDDDARLPDCYVRFNAPEDGDYYVRVRDHLNRGAPEFVYRVEIVRPNPAVTFSIPRVDRYSQQRQQIVVPRGNRFATLVLANRYAFGGELILSPEGLPPGITMHQRPMAANLNLVPVVFEAADDAELTGSLVDMTGRHVDEAKNIVGHFFNLADFALGEPNNSRYYGCQVERLPVAVAEAAPFRIEMVQPSVPIVRDGTMQLKILVHRDEGFDGPIRMQFPFRPPGIGTQYQVEIPKGATEAYYPLNANGSAQLGKWPMYVIGYADAGGPLWVSTQLAELEVAEPLVTMEINRAACERGQPTSIYCKLNHHRAFEGEATAELLGLPPHVTTEPLKFTKDTPELVFQLQTTDQAPIGKHKSLFCRVTVVQNNESIVAVAGRTELQITKPKPVVAAAPKQAPKPAAAPAAKPKSRLQMLREQVQQGGGR